MIGPVSSRIRDTGRYLRLTPFEQETPEGRASERYRRAALSAVADVGAKAGGMGLMLLGVGLTIPYLGAERFGVWATIASLTAMLSLLDLGMGNALINRVAGASASGDGVALTRTASGGLAALVVLGGAVGLLLTWLAAVAPWEMIIKLGDPANLAETRQAAMVFAALFGCNIAATGVRSIFIGLQRAFEAHLALAMAYGVAMIALWYGARAEVDVPTLLLLTFGIQLLSAVALGLLAMFRGVIGWPSQRALVDEGRGLLRTGSLFFVLQIGVMVGWGADSIMIAHIRGAGDVADFSVVQRLFQFVAMPLLVLSAPLWSAYADAMIRQEFAFVRRTLRLSLLVNLIVGSVGVLVIAFAAPVIIPAWTRGTIDVSRDLVVIFGVLTLVQGLGSALGAFLNGAGIIKPQIIAVGLFVVLALPAKWLALSNLGLPAFVLASVVAYLVTHLAVYLTLLARYQQRQAGMGARDDTPEHALRAVERRS